MSLLAVLSFDTAPAHPELVQAVNRALGARGRTRLLQRLWEVEFASRDDFRALADALEALHGENPDAFDYLALLYDLAGGTVLLAPNPNVRKPRPIPQAAAPAPPERVAGIEGPAGTAASEGRHAKRKKAAVRSRGVGRPGARPRRGSGPAKRGRKPARRR